jgi:peptide/nickel transport system substrate-binding protein
MKRFRIQIIIVVVALIAIVVLLLGQQPGDPLASGPAPATGGVYIEGLVGQPSRFNPLLEDFNPIDGDVNRLVFSGLLKHDSWGNPQPDLAQDWGMNVNGDVFNVTLFETAVWHDGEPVTTADVVFTIESMLEPDMPVAPDIKVLWDSVEVVVFDDYNMQFRLSEPFVPFTDYLDFGILPEHLLSGLSVQQLIDAPFNLSPVGSGPYRYEELLLTDGQVSGVVLTAFEDFYRDRAFIDQVVFRYFETSAAAFEAYLNDEIIGIGQVDADTLPAVLNEASLNVYTARMPQMSVVLLNLDNGAVAFFQDVNIRKALITALNRPWMISQALDGQGIVADSPILPGSWAYYDAVETFPYNAQSALDMLRVDGWVIPSSGGAVREKDGVRLSFELVFPDTPVHAALAALIRDYWAEIGVDVGLVPVAYEVLLTDYLEPRSYEAALVDLNLSGSPDPDPYPFWHQSQAAAGQNYSQWNDRRGSEYLEQARVSANFQSRLRFYRNFQVHFTRELPAIPLFYPVYNYAVGEQVQGLSLGAIYAPSDRLINLPTWFLVAGQSQDSLPAEQNP